MFELDHIPEIPGGDQLQKRVDDLNKKAAGHAMTWLKRSICTAADPLFKTGMGDRYFTPTAADGAATIWVLATLASCVVATDWGTPAAWLFRHLHLFNLAHHLSQPYLPGFAGLVFLYYYLSLCKKNADILKSFRAADVPYHSMSRGVIRLTKENSPGLIAILAMLLFFDLGVIIAIGVALFMGKKLADEQEQLIYSRYLDTMDEKLENQYLKAGLLGQAKPEQTYLARPLSKKKFTPEQRNNIAEAFTGRTATAVAQPKPRTGAGNNPTPKTDSPSSRSTPTPAPDAGAASVSNSGHAAVVAAEEPEPASPAMPVKPAVSKTNPKLFGFVMILAVAIAAGSIVRFWPAKPKGIPNDVVTRIVNNPSVPAKAIPNPSPPPAPVVQSQPPQTPPVTASAVGSKSTVPTADANAAAQADLQSQKPKETGQAIEQITTALTNRIAQLAQFTADCQTRLDANDAKIPGFGPADREVLKHNNDSARKTIENNLKNQADTLKAYQVILTAYSNKSLQDPQSTIQRLTNYFEKMDRIHEEITGIFAHLDKDFTPDPH